jgi:hypothetical protein
MDAILDKLAGSTAYEVASAKKKSSRHHVQGGTVRGQGAAAYCMASDPAAVIDLRGKIVPVMDLRVRLGLDGSEATDRRCILVPLVSTDRLLGMANLKRGSKPYLISTGSSVAKRRVVRAPMQALRHNKPLDP